ncbi:PilZ domain-containing protein [Sorangium sp. So ce1036]|uniref:PilZ domain-containing protein n=1 Tax=Sorangium sp. So ce1036 TaxID=3133328 RepID=UPI003F027F02
MNVRGAEGDGVRKAPESVERDREGGGERRGGAGQRVRIEALVAVGETSGGGFEAESIDMSPEGMRLRTAYLPKVGDALICRFDGLGKELVVEGEVCWRAEQARGGEFGLRFTGLDAEAEETVRAMCASMDAGAARPASELAAPAAAAPAALEAAQRGARVRLHIDGLGSPMKARVRAGGSDELEVGSNLEFLKVGRTLELEEVERGARREAYIDHVKVEIDPATSVPQLVVSLRYDAPRVARASRPRLAPSEGQPPARPASTSASQPPARPASTSASQPPARPSPTLVSQPSAPARPASTSASQPPARPSPADDGATARPSAAPPRAPADDGATARVSATPARPSSPPPRDRAEDAPAGASAEPAAGASGRAAVDDGDDQDGDLSPAPRDARAGGEAPSSASDAVASSAQDAPDGAEAEAAAAGQPSRLRDVGEKAAKAGKVVAGKLGPALAGAGSRAASAMAGVVARIRNRRAAAAAGEGAGAGKDGGARRTTAPPPAGALKSGGRRLVREEADAGAGGEAAEPPQRFNPKAAALGSFLGLATVLVLFGAARLVGLVGGDAPSGEVAGTAESAPALPAASGAPALAAAAAPAAAGGALTANVPLFGATPLSTTEPVPPTPPESSAQADDSLDPGMPGGPGDEDADEEDEQAAPQEWGRGVVRSPTVLRLKMDGPIEEVTGAAGAMGFTVSLPDRRALSSGSGLARKDKRIASVRVVNTPHGAEVTLKFKDGVPAYRAKARGDRLEIAIGRDEPKKVASKSKKEKDRKKSSDDKKRDKDKER